MYLLRFALLSTDPGAAPQIAVRLVTVGPPCRAGLNLCSGQCVEVGQQGAFVHALTTRMI